MDVQESVNDLVKMCLSGQMMDAFEKYYADDVVMQENEQDPRKGKDANRTFEQEWMASVAEVHSSEAKTVAVAGDKAVIEWTMDVSFKDGNRVTMSEVAVQTWKDGKIVHEKFYYDMSGMQK